MRLYDFEHNIDKGTSLKYKVSFKETTIYSSDSFSESVSSSLRLAVTISLTEADISEDQCLLITFFNTFPKKPNKRPENPSEKMPAQAAEEEKVVGKLSMPISQLIRRSILNQEFRGALKIMKIEENVLDTTTKLNDNNVMDAENQFIYNEYASSTNNITEFFLQEMHGNLLGFAIVSITIRLQKSLSVIPNHF